MWTSTELKGRYFKSLLVLCEQMNVFRSLKTESYINICNIQAFLRLISFSDVLSPSSEDKRYLQGLKETVLNNLGGPHFTEVINKLY